MNRKSVLKVEVIEDHILSPYQTAISIKVLLKLTYHDKRKLYLKLIESSVKPSSKIGASSQKYTTNSK